jgi:glucose/arabinose dehydrogenase
VLAVAHSTYDNHNGGMVVFGPDGYLYTGLGDGGGGGDPLGSGQNKHVLLGKILRLDVDHGSPYTIPATNPFVGDTSGRAEIWDYGLRNPWRFSFDRSNGYLYIGDVGENLYEEVDVEPSGGLGRVNSGWNVMEGMHCYNAMTCNSAGLTLPVLEYSHTSGQCAIIGGYVYRGKRVPILAGQYLYADLCTGWIRSFQYVFGRVGNQLDWSTQLSTGTNVSSFGEDGRGELYIVNLGGNVYRIVPAP